MQTKANIENQLQAKLNELRRNTIPQKCLDFCLDFVHTRVGKVIKNYEVKPYGGAANQLSSMKNGDIDCTIICDLKNLQFVQRTNTNDADSENNDFGRIIQSENDMKLALLSKLDIGELADNSLYNNPVVRFSIKYNNQFIDVDVTINSDFPIQNTKYIEQCIGKFKHASDLILYLKHMLQVHNQARANSVNSIKSYAIYMMVIHYLSDQKQPNKKNFVDILRGFLSYFMQFNWEDQCVVQSMNNKYLETRKNDFEGLFVLDPFEQDRNVSDNMTYDSTRQLFELFRNVFDYLSTLSKTDVCSMENCMVHIYRKQQILWKEVQLEINKRNWACVE
ncbi:PAP/25A_associated domain family [Hexamita inflata]|uniref:PAP/25A associated domain family n=1 Tax=Hexamita inflata TaxID=28002 RepID=A0AA86TNI1_9EUKA|nr:PAP/25A associated domain family [Hexamita inflata]